MKVMLLCDAMTRGFTSAALKIPGENAYIYAFVDMVVSYGFFLKLYSMVGQDTGRKDLATEIITWPIIGVVARVAGIFAGFAAALALDYPVRLIDAVCMSGASTVAVVVVHLIKSRQ